MLTHSLRSILLATALLLAVGCLPKVDPYESAKYSCSSSADCAEGFVCAQIGGVNRCLKPEHVPDTADGVTPDQSVDQTQPDKSGDVEPDVEQIKCTKGNNELDPEACKSGMFCNKAGFCETAKEAGVECGDKAFTGVSADRVCRLGACQQGPFNDTKYCVTLTTTCGNQGEPAPEGYVVCNGNTDDPKYAICGSDGKWGTVEPCESESCEDDTGERKSSCVDGVGCVVSTSCTSCFPGKFDSDEGRCTTDCSDDDDCASGADCVNSVCVKSTKKSKGQPCTIQADCQAGLFCIRALDESGKLTGTMVCCDADCSGSCEGCKSDGSCGKVGLNQPDSSCSTDTPDETGCGTNGQCDGQGNCSRWPAGTKCGDPTCGCDTIDPTICTALGNSTCDAQGNCNKSTTPISCPTKNNAIGGCNGDNSACNFGECPGGTQKECTDLDPILFCNKDKKCQAKLAKFDTCNGLSVDSTKPFDDLVCSGDLQCLKANENDGTIGRCGEAGRCITQEGLNQWDVGTTLCGSSPYRCKIVNGRPEWEKLAACDPTHVGCELVPNDPNSGIQNGEVCAPQAQSGCQLLACKACPNNTRFDTNGGKCFDSCTSDAECPSDRRCNDAKGTCVKVAEQSQSCQDQDKNSSDYKPCRAGLFCVQGVAGDRICCTNNCDGPCVHCNPQGDKCKDRFNTFQTPLCNANPGSICGKQTGFCDGAGKCALPGAETECQISCADKILSTKTCDGQGGCLGTTPDVTCTLGCADAKSCLAENCKNHGECAAAFFCGSDGKCKARLNQGQRCEGLGIGGSSFDDKVCADNLFCRDNPQGDKGYCAPAGTCPINAQTMLNQGEHHCDGQWTSYECAQDGWKSESCDQLTKIGCNPDGLGQNTGYQPPSQCDLTGGCQPQTNVCVSCPNNLLFDEGPEQCFPSCTQPTPDDYYCRDDLWCTEGGVCVERLAQGKLCTDPGDPKRQCEDGNFCCLTIIGQNPDTSPIHGNTSFCSECCEDGKCPGGWCKISGGDGFCTAHLGVGGKCNRDAQCDPNSAPKCCNDVCAECCDNSDCTVPGKGLCSQGSCVAKKSGGEQCFSNDECKTDKCSNSECTCSIQGNIGCPSGKFCDDPFCKDKFDFGVINCTFDEQCIGGRCCNGVCGECCDSNECDTKTQWCDTDQTVQYFTYDKGQTFPPPSYRCLQKKDELGTCVRDEMCKGKCLMQPHNDLSKDGICYDTIECGLDTDCVVIGEVCCLGTCMPSGLCDIVECPNPVTDFYCLVDPKSRSYVCCDVKTEQCLGGCQPRFGVGSGCGDISTGLPLNHSWCKQTLYCDDITGNCKGQ